MKRTMRECVKRVSIALVVLMCCIGTTLAKNKKEQESYNMRRVQEYIEWKELDNALIFAEREMSENPKNPDGHLMAGFLYYATGEPGKALTALHRSLQLYPKKEKGSRALAHSCRSKVYLEMMLDTVAALNDMQEAYRLNPDESDYASDLATLYAELERFDESNSILHEMAQKEPGNPYPYHLLAWNATSQELYDQAMEYIGKAEKLDPRSLTPDLLRLRVYRKQDDLQKLLDTAIFVLYKDMDNDEAYASVFYASKSLYPQAIRALTKGAIDNKTEAWQWHMMKGIVHEQHKDYAKAIEAFEQSMNASNDRESFNGLLISCYNKLGDYATSERLASETLELYPDDTEMLLERADARYYQRNFDGAREDLIKCMECDSEYSSLCYLQLGIMDEIDKNYEAALFNYDMALMLLDIDICKIKKAMLLYTFLDRKDEAREIAREIIDNISEEDKSESGIYPYALYILGQYDEVRSTMDAIIEEDPEDEGEYYNYACLCSLMKDKDGALSNLRKAIDLGYRNVNHMSMDSDLNFIHDTPEYEDMIAGIQPITQIAIVDEEPVKTVTYTVPLVKQYGGTYLVKAVVNGLPIDFILDTGCSDVSISQVECDFMLKNGYLKRSDFLGTQRFVDATGKVSASQVINIDSITIGDHEIKNIRAGVVPNQQAPLLLGMEVLNRFGRVEIDPVKNILTITVVEKE